MDWLLDLWHNLSAAQATLIGGTTVLFAGIVAFGTGSLNRQSEAKRFHYEEMKKLYAEALRIGRDLELLKAVPAEDREKILGETIPAMQLVISELSLIGNYETADFAIAYMYQQSVKLAGWTRDTESDVDLPDQLLRWFDNLTDEERTALRKYHDVNINRRDVVQAVRKELALYAAVWRHRYVLRKRIKEKRFAIN